jgi:hypothetical protein
MKQLKKRTVGEIKGDLKTYFNWSINALVPVRPQAADVYLTNNLRPIKNIAQKLLREINFSPSTIYRGIILREPVSLIAPCNGLKYLSFSTDQKMAEHFADVHVFDSYFFNISDQVGDYGYVIQYTPTIHEVLFHYQFLSVLPYIEVLSLIGMNGAAEVAGLEKQKQIMILQPKNPFTNFYKFPK